MSRIVAIAGSTGLVGSMLRHQLQLREEVSEIRLLQRSPQGIQSSKENEIIVNYELFDQVAAALEGVDELYCCIGTTNKKVQGNKSAYRKVDFDIPLALGKAAKKNGIKVMLKISAAGADAQSVNSYARLKGEIEEALKNLDLESLYIVRPSMLLGPRKEFRFGEKMGQIIMQIFHWIIPKKWRAVQASDVAKAMIVKAKKPQKGNHVISNEEIQLF